MKKHGVRVNVFSYDKFQFFWLYERWLWKYNNCFSKGAK